MFIFINLLILVLILFIIYWFWIYKPKIKREVKDEVEVIIAGGVYKPDMIHAIVGKPLTIKLLLQDEAHCAKTIIFDEFNISKELDLNKVETIKIIPDKVGEFAFHCPMSMFVGKIIVNENEQEVIVDGGVYIPEIIQADLGKPIKLKFLRKDASHCAETLVISDFSVSEILPYNEIKEITLTPDKAGEFEFGCAMGMYKGKLQVK